MIFDAQHFTDSAILQLSDRAVTQALAPACVVDSLLTGRERIENRPRKWLQPVIRAGPAG